MSKTKMWFYKNFIWLILIIPILLFLGLWSGGCLNQCNNTSIYPNDVDGIVAGLHRSHDNDIPHYLYICPYYKLIELGKIEENLVKIEDYASEESMAGDYCLIVLFRLRDKPKARLKELLFRIENEENFTPVYPGDSFRFLSLKGMLLKQIDPKLDSEFLPFFENYLNNQPPSHAYIEDIIKKLKSEKT